MRVRREESAVLVVDYQEKLLPAMCENEKLLERVQILLTGLRELEIPMIVTQQYTKGLGMTVKGIQDVVGNDFIEKIRFSAYEDVKEQIKGKKYIIVCGIEAHICVLQTVIDLKEAGIIPVLVTDCVSSRKKQDMEMAFERAKAEGAVLTTYEAILFELLEKAGSDTSKKIQRLIR